MWPRVWARPDIRMIMRQWKDISTPWKMNCFITFNQKLPVYVKDKASKGGANHPLHTLETPVLSKQQSNDFFSDKCYKKAWPQHFVFSTVILHWCFIPHSSYSSFTHTTLPRGFFTSLTKNHWQQFHANNFSPRVVCTVILTVVSYSQFVLVI